jgi:CRISPR-associated protein Cmr1
MRGTKMQEKCFEMKFLTPAFLGDAEQKGVWRTPPIKALLRQWWRVAYAAGKKFEFDIQNMRHEEGLLFGHAWLKDDYEKGGRSVSARKSKVRLRLEAWAQGTQSGVSPLPKILDTSYAWFGIVDRGNGLPDRRGIKAAPDKESACVLHIAAPDECMEQIIEVISLMNAFGVLGSRSRGGWGALQIENAPFLQLGQMSQYARPWTDCLQSDWPMSLAMAEGGLCLWHSKKPFKKWDDAMKFVAARRKDVRSSLKISDSGDVRAALGFASPGRMASPLRWKIVSNGDELKVRVFAMPHRIPQDGGIHMTPNDLKVAWKTVLGVLNSSNHLCRVQE